MEDLYRKLKGQESPEHQELLQELSRLNEYQRAAVTDQSRVLLLSAQVGSGKTTVLIDKILYLHFVKGVPLESMVVLTFTNKAAQEIKLRIREKNRNIKEEELRFFGTFHGVCRTLLSSVLPVSELGYAGGFSIYDADGMLELYERVMNENSLTLKYKNKIRKRIEQHRQGKLLYGNMKHDDDLAEFIRLLEAEKKRCNVMEFDDLIENAAELLSRHEYSPEWIIIDEFQDSDDRQLELIQRMKKEKTHIFAVGDPNQVIYTWRGSKKDIFSEFRKAHGGNELTLPINYRSTSTILDAAKAFLEPGQLISGVRDKGRLIIVKKHHNTFNEALYLCDRIKKLAEDGYKYGDIAVLYRKQKQSEVFRDVFEKHDIPHEVSLKRTLRDIPVLYWLTRLLKAAVNPNDKDSMAYILCDGRYGPGMSKKKIKEVIDSMEADKGLQIELVKKVVDFKEWCNANNDTGTEKLFEYFDLGAYLMPTSITYGEDRERVLLFLEDIKAYLESTNKDRFRGIKDYLDNSALYGSRVPGDGTEKGSGSVKLMTLHASKGLEFRQVFISGANLGLIPIPARTQGEEEEEKRLFFVGITRAKDSLEISYHTNPDEFGVYGIPSPYLRMISPELIDSEDFVSRSSKLSELRRDIKANIDIKESKQESEAAIALPAANAKVYHEKYGQGMVASEDEANITVEFEVYGTKVFSKAFCPLRYEK
ncbi:MAG TPA: ATP-dependent helicase [Clostridia bacterium]|nr:ATP-dependent helicase [Clostridia bacterium]